MARDVDWVINPDDHGIHLPTGGTWVDLPRSPFQVMTRSEDLAGTFHVRVRPAYAAYWDEFMSTKDQGGGHMILCEDPQCPGCM